MAKKINGELHMLVACALELVEFLESIKGEERAKALAAVKMVRVPLAMKDWHPKDRESLNKIAALRHCMGEKGIGALGWLAQTEFNIETITQVIYGH
jgi:hypothetical protein